MQFLNKKANDAVVLEEPQTVSVEEPAVLTNFWVDFSKSISYAHTKPISCKYKGLDISCAGWNALFINLTRLVSVMMVNNEIGTIEPIKELAAVAHTHGALFHTDAVQAVGHISIDVNEIGIDMLSASAHKFNGPKGIGFLYIRKGTQIRPLADGGAQEFHMRAGTENIASIVGMAVALQKNCRTMQETSTKLQAMDHAFIDALHEAGIDFVRNGSANRMPGIISISIRGISGEMLLHRLDLKGISISTGSACDSVNTRVSHVIKAIGIPSAYAQGTIRVSFGRDNQIEEAVNIAQAIEKIVHT